MADIDCVKIMVQVYERVLSHNKELLYMLDHLTQDQRISLQTDYAHDFNRTFNVNDIGFKIREASDRLYYLDNLITTHQTTTKGTGGSDTEEEECVHTLVTDMIDLDVERSASICYCSKCGETFD